MYFEHGYNKRVLIPLEILKLCFTLMYYKVRKMINGILGVRMTYGNVSSYIMMVGQTLLKNIYHMKSFIMKPVSMNKTRGREKNILKLAWVNVISRTSWDVSYL